MTDAAAATSAEMIAQIKELQDAAAAQRKESREADIRHKVAGHKSVGARRTIAHLMKSTHILDDIDACWDKLAAEAERESRDTATADNLVRINKAINGQAPMLVELRKHINHELTMQTVASQRPAGWQLVNWKEAGPDYDPSLDMTLDDVRQAEKEMNQYYKDISSAERSKESARGGGRARGAKRVGNKEGEGSSSGGARSSNPASPATTPKKKKPNSGCWTCGSEHHMARACPDKKKN